MNLRVEYVDVINTVEGGLWNAREESIGNNMYAFKGRVEIFAADMVYNEGANDLETFDEDGFGQTRSERDHDFAEHVEEDTVESVLLRAIVHVLQRPQHLQ